MADFDPVLPAARASDTGSVCKHGLEIVMAVAQGIDSKGSAIVGGLRAAGVTFPAGLLRGRAPT
ncbi:hypothetical protein [Streptomyces sp. NPDC046870]|uniref:hypothetical protein n=1 Tax=Streptomyces sp. NPDC046870 TaxID=3155135 RepID=UPI0034561544